MTLGPEAPRVTVGRNPDCVIHTTRPSVSRRHSEFTWQDGLFEVADLGSSNGTSVNGREVRRQALRDRDEVRCGDFVVHFYQDDAPATGATPPPIPQGAPVMTAEAPYAALAEHHVEQRTPASQPAFRQEGYPGEPSPYQQPYGSVGSGSGWPRQGRPAATQNLPLITPSTPHPDNEALRRENQRLTDRVAELEVSLSLQREAAPAAGQDHLRRELEQLKKDRDAARDDYDAARTRQLDAEREARQLRQDRDRLQDNADRVQEELSSLRVQLREQDAELNRLRLDADRLQQQLDDRADDGDRDALDEQLRRLEIDLQEAREQRLRAEQLSDTRGRELNEIRALLKAEGHSQNAQQEEAGRLRLVLEAKELRLEELERELDDLREELHRRGDAGPPDPEVLRDLQQQRQANEDLQARLKDLDADLREHRDRADRAQALAAQRLDALLPVQRDLDALRAQYEAARNDLAELDDLREDLPHLKERADRAEERRKRAEEAREALVAEVARLQEESQRLAAIPQPDPDALPKALEDLQKAQAGAQQAAEDLQQALEDRRRALDAQQQTLGDLQRAQEDLQKALEDLQKTREDLQQAQEEARRAHEAGSQTLQADFQALQADFQTLQADFQEVHDQREALQGEVLRLQGEVQRLQGALEEAQQAPPAPLPLKSAPEPAPEPQIEALRLEIDRLERALQRREEQIQSLEAEVEHLDSLMGDSRGGTDPGDPDPDGDELSAQERDLEVTRALEEALAQLQQDRDALQLAAQQAQGEQQRLAQAAHELQEALAQLEQERDQRDLALDEAQQRQQRLDQERQEAQGALAALQAQLQGAQARLEELQQERDALQEALDEAQRAPAPAPAAPAGDPAPLIARVEDAHSAILPRLSVAEDDPSVMIVSLLDAPLPGSDLTELFRRESAELAEEIDALRAELSPLRDQLAASRALQTQAEGQLQRHQQDLENIRLQYEVAGEELGRMREALSSSADTAEGFRQALEGAQAELSQTRASLDGSQQQLREMEAELSRSRQELTATSQQLNAVSQQLRALPASESGAESAEVTELRDQVQDAWQSLNDSVTGLRNNMRLIGDYVADVRKIYDALRRADLKPLPTLDRVRLEKALRDAEPDVTFEELEFLIGDCANYAEDMKEHLIHFRAAVKPDAHEQEG